MSTRRGGGGPCAFCEIAAGRAEAELVLEGAATFAFLDRAPLFPGHVLLVPRAHHVTLPELPEELVGPLFADARRLARAVVEATGAEGSFVAMNNGVSQSVPHLHVHVVPRTKGDGLRGFFWPRVRYASREHAQAVARSIRAALEPEPPVRP